MVAVNISAVLTLASSRLAVSNEYSSSCTAVLVWRSSLCTVEVSFLCLNMRRFMVVTYAAFSAVDGLHGLG